MVTKGKPVYITKEETEELGENNIKTNKDRTSRTMKTARGVIRKIPIDMMTVQLKKATKNKKLYQLKDMLNAEIKINQRIREVKRAKREQRREFEIFTRRKQYQPETREATLDSATRALFN